MNIEKMYPWSFIGVILAVILTGVTIYWSEFRNFYSISFVVDNEVSLLEVREGIENLSIKYNDNDLLATKQAIKILQISIKNNGATILQSYYDRKMEFGMEFEGSKILNFKVDSTSDDYLDGGFKPQIADSETNNGMLTFDKVIFDKESYVRLRVYLLQPDHIKTTKINAKGKIANIDSIEIIYNKPVEKEQMRNHLFQGLIMLAVLFVSTFLLLFSIKYFAARQLEVNLSKQGVMVNRDKS